MNAENKTGNRVLGIAVVLLAIIGMGTLGVASVSSSPGFGTASFAPESYILRVGGFSYDASTELNYIDVQKLDDGEWVDVCAKRTEGDVCNVGSLVLTVEEILYGGTGGGDKQATFSSNGYFDRVFEDSSGNTVVISDESGFPAETYTFEVLDDSGKLIEDYVFGWEFPNDIVLIENNVYQNEVHYFDFEIVDEEYVSIQARIEDGSINRPVLYGNGNQFLGTGENEFELFVVSSGDTLTFDVEADHEMFVGSWDGN